MRIYYKAKQVENSFFILFKSETEEVFINNDKEKVKEYLEEHKRDIFVGGANYTKDDFLLTSIIKNNNLDGEITDEDFYLLPLTIDTTQGIVKGMSMKLDVVLANLGFQTMPVFIENPSNITEEEIDNIHRELSYKVDFIKYLETQRIDYLDFRANLIDKYDLPKESFRDTASNLMSRIVGLQENKTEGFEVSKELSFLLDEEFYRELLNDFKEMDIPSREYNGTNISYVSQGIKGSRISIDTNEGNYLYIDFNSFGPSILINNKYLEDCSTHPQRYEELRDLRIELKAQKNRTQVYYKTMLNSFIDNTFKASSNGNNIGKSISITGAFIMTYLINILQRFNIEIIDANTDGIIIRCDKKYNDEIKEIVKQIEKRFNMSCDVDVITKLIHKDVQNYAALFETGKIKHIGVFGKAQDEMIQTNSLSCIDQALTNYFLFGIPPRETLENLLNNNNNLLAFQKVLRQGKKNTKKYIFENGVYKEVTADAIVLFAVTDIPRLTLYEEKKLKGKSTIKAYSKDNLEYVLNPQEFDISRIDIDYYEKLVEEKIESITGERKTELTRKLV